MSLPSQSRGATGRLACSVAARQAQEARGTLTSPHTSGGLHLPPCE